MRKSAASAKKAKARRALSDMARKAILGQAYRGFWDCATTRATETAALWQSDTQAAETFGAAYCGCIEDAVGELADLLAQAAIARRVPITASVSNGISEEAVRLALPWAEWPTAGRWLAMAMGFAATERDGISPEVQSAFMGRIDQFLPTWRMEAERRIELRGVLSAKPVVRPSKLAGVKLLVAMLKARNPGISHKATCAKLDASNDHDPNSAPLVPAWREFVTTWSHALAHPKLKNRVEVFISKVQPLAS